MKRLLSVLWVFLGLKVQEIVNGVLYPFRHVDTKVSMGNVGQFFFTIFMGLLAGATMVGCLAVVGWVTWFLFPGPSVWLFRLSFHETSLSFFLVLGCFMLYVTAIVYGTIYAMVRPFCGWLSKNWKKANEIVRSKEGHHD